MNPIRPRGRKITTPTTIRPKIEKRRSLKSRRYSSRKTTMHRADHGAGQRALSPGEHHDDHGDHEGEAEHFGADIGDVMGIEAAGESAHRRRQHEGDQAEIERPDPDRLRDEPVLPHRDRRAPDIRIDEAIADQERCGRQHQAGIVEPEFLLRRRLRRRSTAGLAIPETPIGPLVRSIQLLAISRSTSANTECHDDEERSAQAQRHRTDGEAEDRCNDAGERDRDIDRQSEAAPTTSAAL